MSDAGPKGRPPIVDAIAGALAGCVARFAVGPLDVVKIRFQVQLEPISKQAVKVANSKYTGFGQALLTILKEEGVQVNAQKVLLRFRSISSDLQAAAVLQFHCSSGCQLGRGYGEEPCLACC